MRNLIGLFVVLLTVCACGNKQAQTNIAEDSTPWYENDSLLLAQLDAAIQDANSWMPQRFQEPDACEERYSGRGMGNY